MCGIFGKVTRDKAKYSFVRSEIENLFKLSTLRGKDSSGICIRDNNKGSIFKLPISAEKLIKHYNFNQFCNKALEESKNQEFISFMGQCRLMTNGSSIIEDYNLPTKFGEIIAVHNGIITNSILENDSAFLFNKLNTLFSKENSIANSAIKMLKDLNGSLNIACQFEKNNKLLLATNNGSLYYYLDKDELVYASERIFLEKHLFKFKYEHLDIVQLSAQKALIYDMETGDIKHFSLDKDQYESIEQMKKLKTNIDFKYFKRDINQLKKCVKCILPETYPYIKFDKDGVCNFCNHYQRQKLKGEESLLKRLDKYRSKDGSVDCIIGLSGGRDSCYGLHLLKKKYGMNPIAYTFDWGLTTDISRKNQALMTSALQVEHIIRTPNIIKKRRYIRKNVNSWLKKPHLGMIPLFQAGDKDFYHYGRQLKDELNLELTVLCSGYQLEQREFMIGFMGIDQPPVRNNHDFYYHPLSTKLKLAYKYSLEYLKNPSYINESFYDSIRAYIISFFAKADFLYLFNYIPWNENEINNVLKDQYGWISDKGYGDNQWRMGDGQTAFNNYIYYKLAGFSEYDAFRSNQIREGLITRDKALRLATEDNEPKFKSIKEFFDLVGLPFEEVMRKIETIEPIF